MKNFAETEKNIRDLVPRLKELSFGCLIYVAGDHDRVFRIPDQVVVKQRKSGREYIRLKGVSSQSWTEVEFEDFRNRADVKIIGHPITLEDVLEAVQKKQSTSVEVFFDSDKDLVIRQSGDGPGGLWSLGKPFPEQPEETKDFIENLLTNE